MTSKGEVEGSALFCGVLPLLAHSLSKLSPGSEAGVTERPTAAPKPSEEEVSLVVEASEVEEVEEVESSPEEPPPSIALTQALSRLQRLNAKKTKLTEELQSVNNQLAQVMSANESREEEIREAEVQAEDPGLAHLQHLQTGLLAADTLARGVENFQNTELLTLQREVNALQAAQKLTTSNLTTDIRVLEALLSVLRKKERELSCDLWRAEARIALSERRREAWEAITAATTTRAEEQGKQFHMQLTALEIECQDFMQVNKSATEVCQALTPHHQPQRSPPHPPSSSPAGTR